jgi:hypothetical protein
LAVEIAGWQAKVAFPGVDQLIKVATLGGRELVACDDPARLVRIIIVDRSLESLAQRMRLAELPAEPAEKADPRCTTYRS